MTSTNTSPHARVRGVGLDEARWTQGFWAERFAVCREQTIPGLWALMEGTERSHYYQNFRIAAGLAEGRHRGAPFNDGDFYKWLEAACALLAAAEDPELDRRIEEIIAVIGQAQRADGYLHTRVLIRQKNGDPDARPFGDPNDFELYNMGHLLTTACVHHRATGRTSLLAIARKTADFLDEAFRHPTPQMVRCSTCPSHIMGMIDLYRATGEPRYLELANTFLDARDLITDGGDDNQDRVPFRQQTEAVGHAVRANYLYAGAADLFAETGDATLWGPLEQIWTSVVERKLYITGGCGALYDGASPDGASDQKSITRVHQAYGRNYQLPSITAHNETCAAIGSVLWNWRLFLVTGEASFVDLIERTLYNSVLSGVSLGGTDFFYNNPLRKLDTPPTELRWPRTRAPYFSSFCCPPNVARTLVETSGYAYGASEDAMWVNLYGGGTLTTALPGGQIVTLAQETQYPWNGRIRITLGECGDAPFALKLRIPGWTEGATVRLNDLPLPGDAPLPGTYFEIRRVWRAGDVVDLDLPMPARLIEAHPLVEETLGQVAVKRGPLVYCLESADLPPGTRLLDVRIPADIDLVARYDGRLLGGVVVLEGKARAARPAGEWNGALYRALTATPLAPLDVRFIPYFAWGNRGDGEMSVWLPLHWA